MRDISNDLEQQHKDVELGAVYDNYLLSYHLNFNMITYNYLTIIYFCLRQCQFTLLYHLWPSPSLPVSS